MRAADGALPRRNDAEPRVTYRGLDAFRLFAFLAVFLFHVSLLESGYLGVQAFFVLSGFLITPILVEMRGQLPPGRYLLNFYGRRSLRIFPLYYAYLAAVGGIAALPFATDRIPRPETQRAADQLVYAFTPRSTGRKTAR